MGKDTGPVSVQVCEESVSELKPGYMVAGDLFRPVPTVASTVCTDAIKRESDSVIVMNNKQYDSRKFSKCAINSPNFIGEDSTAHKNAVASDKRQTTFCNWNLPLHGGSDTLVIPESTHADYLSTISESFMLYLGDDLPNESASTKKKKGVLAANWNGKARMSLIESLFGSSAYIDPKTQEPQCKQCPTGQQSTGKSSQAESGGSNYQGSCVVGFSSSSTRSSLVTGIGSFGGGGGGDEDPWHNRPVTLPQSSHYTDYVAFPDEQTASYRHAIITPSPVEVPVETPARFTRLGSQPAFYEDIPELPFLSPTMEATEETSSDIGSALDLIHLMSRHNIRQNMHPGQGLVSPNSPVPADLDVATSPCPTPCTPASLASPASQPATTPQLTTTPQQASSSSPSSLFIPKTFIRGDKRICELAVPEDMSHCNRIMALRALFHSADLYWKFEQCLAQPYDLKVANDTRANLCDFTFDHEQSKLVFSMPKDCKPVGEWLRDNRESMDLRDGLLILQQVMNTLAAIHTLGNEDFLSFWGAFMVWVSPDMRVYLLVDFPEMYRKQQVFASSDDNLNPRIEDIRAIHELYNMIVQPFTEFNSCWVSPGVYQVMVAYESLLGDPTSGSRLAELARTLGEKRMCKLEVDLETLGIFIYCLDHESLQSALQPLRSIVPGRLSQLWCVQWMRNREMVKRRDVATADRKMLFKLIPIEDIRDDDALHIAAFQ